MDMNAFRNFLAQRSTEDGEENKPQHRAFGADLDSLRAEAYGKKKAKKEDNEDDEDDEESDELEEAQVTAGKTTGRGTTSPDLDRVDLPGSNERARKAKMKRVRQQYGGPEPKKKDPTEEFSLTGRDIVEAFEIVNLFCESVMEEYGLNEETEDIDQIIEDALNSLDLDEDYGKMPAVSQGLGDEEKKKVQKGEKSQMPTAGVEDKLPGEQQSNIDAIKAVLGGKKGSAAGSAY